MASFVSSVTSALSGVAQVTKDANTLKNSYNSLRSTISSATLGTVKLPSVSSSLTNYLKIGKNAQNILNILGLTSSGTAGNASRIQTSNLDVNTGPFKWAEMETTPDSFATADSVLLFAGESLYANIDTGAELVPIGLCQGFSFSSGITVVTFKELRCEENMVVPCKSQPGSMQLSRLCGAYSSLSNRLHILPNWNYSTQSTTFKPLFGIMAMFLTPSRQNSISTLYFERCAINNFSLGISANSFQIVDNLNITYGRCIGVGNLTQANSVSTTTSPTAAAAEKEESDYTYANGTRTSMPDQFTYSGIGSTDSHVSTGTTSFDSTSTTSGTSYGLSDFQ